MMSSCTVGNKVSSGNGLRKNAAAVLATMVIHAKRRRNFVGGPR
jgi:hypothetical protein